jgi:ATP-dependent helicase/nuclease subunit B
MSSQSDTDSDIKDVADPAPATASEGGHTPTVELVGRTRQEEARLAVATAAGLIERGVSPSDIVIATADVDRYEDSLDRAAARYGRTLAIWTPLTLKRTIPYRLVAATLTLLAEREQGAVAIETLTEPLTLGWVPTNVGSEPLAPAAIHEVARVYAGVTQSIDEWTATIAAADIEHATKQDWVAYLNWIAAQPDAPTSKDVTDTLEPVCERYDEACLPESPGGKAVSELADTLRGFERTTELVTMSRRRYARWLAAGRADNQWSVVRDLLESFATSVPGRRELPTAAAIDVKEANDLWGLSAPYVIAAGLVEGEWPTTPASPVPSAARTVIETADIAGFRPHTAWTTARDRDQFEAVHSAATTALVATRHTTDADGVEKRPSRFLEGVETARVPTEAKNRLMAEPSTLPEPLRDCLSMEVNDE